MSTIDREVGSIIEELLGIHSMNPFVQHSSSPRASMMSGQLSQPVVLCEPETPIIQTGVEFELAKNTFSVKFLEESRIIKVIKKYGGITLGSVQETTELLIVFEIIETGEIDCLTIPKFHKLHTHFGFEYIWDEEVISWLEPNAIIPEGTVVADSPGVINKHEYGYGLVTNTAFMSIPEISGDGVVISESYAKKLRFKIYETKDGVEFGDDNIPLNTYGDDNTYKAFPEVGEYVNDDSILIATRKIDPLLAPALYSNIDLQSASTLFDNCMYSKLPGGKIVDIEIVKTTKNKKELPTGTNGIIDKYADNLVRYYQEIHDLYKELERERYIIHRDNNLNITPRFNRICYESIVRTTNKRVIYTHKSDRVDMYRCKFHIEHEIINLIGGKLTNLHGGKGVICGIRPDNQMPIDANGVRADIIMDPTSITGRMNISALYEHYFNGMSRTSKKRITDKFNSYNAKLESLTVDQINELFSMVLELTKVLNTEQHVVYTKANIEEKIEILEEIITREFYLEYHITSKKKAPEIIAEVKGTHLAPLNIPISINIDGEVKLTKEATMIAPQYMFYLAKTPDEFLAVASAKVNHHNLPVGVSGKNRDELPYRQNPTKVLSETETRLMLSYVNPEVVAELKDRGNSIETHAHVYKQILNSPKPTNIDRIVDREKYPYGTDKAIEFVENILEPSGIKLEYISEKQITDLTKDLSLNK